MTVRETARVNKPRTSTDTTPRQPPEARDLPIDLIRTDGGTQPRVRLDDRRLDEYTEAARDGAEFPPGVVFCDGDRYWLAEGFHRREALRRADKKTMSVFVRQGGQREALLWAAGTNAGLERSNEDKRRVVLWFLQDAEWSKWSDREIGRRCRVDHRTVARYRRELLTGEFPSEEPPENRTFITKHGTPATMNVGNIGRATAANGRAAKPAKFRASPGRTHSLVDVGAPEPVSVLWDLGLLDADTINELTTVQDYYGPEILQYQGENAQPFGESVWELDQTRVWFLMNALRPLDAPTLWHWPWFAATDHPDLNPAVNAVVAASRTVAHVLDRRPRPPRWEVVASWYACAAVLFHPYACKVAGRDMPMAAWLRLHLDNWREHFRAALFWGGLMPRPDRSERNGKATIEWLGYRSDLRHAGITDEMIAQSMKALQAVDADACSREHLGPFPNLTCALSVALDEAQASDTCLLPTAECHRQHEEEDDDGEEEGEAQEP
jgi:hypothetical protein